MIAPDAQALADDLCRQVPIAEMPGNPNEMMGIPAPNFSQRFRGPDDFYEAAILQNKLDDQPLPGEEEQRALPLHENIRGSRYYLN